MNKYTKEQIQENSFSCRLCGKYWTEESGAYDDFVCEDCYCEKCDKPMDDRDGCCMCAEEREESIESNYPIEGYQYD